MTEKKIIKIIIITIIQIIIALKYLIDNLIILNYFFFILWTYRDTAKCIIRLIIRSIWFDSFTQIYIYIYI